MEIKDVFIIMPFGAEEIKHKGKEKEYSQDHFDDIYLLLKDAVNEHDENINVDRMEQRHGNLVNAIIRRLSTSDCVIAVLSGKNPNVFYELGIRHSLRQNTIMLVEDYDEYPFDLNSYYSYKYSLSNETKRRDLKEFIKKRLLEISEGDLSPDSPVLEVLEASEYEQTKALNSLELVKTANIIHGLLHEIMGVYGVLRRAHEDLDNGVNIRKIKMTYTIMEGFVQNRLLAGFTNDSYLDASVVLNDWRAFENIWNQMLEDSEDSEDSEDLEMLIADTNRNLTAFCYDLLNASKYIFDNKSPYLSFWGKSIRNIEETIPNGETLMKANQKVLTLISGEAERLTDYFSQHTTIEQSAPDTLAEFINGS